MANFFTPTNENRIAKMVEMIEGPLTKSASSNKATTEDWYTLVSPLLDALREVGLDIENVDQPVTSSESSELTDRENQLRDTPDGLREPSEGAPHAKGQWKPLWATVRQMAEEAPIEELGQAMVVYATRMDDMMQTCIDRQEKPAPVEETEVEEDEDAWD